MPNSQTSLLKRLKERAKKDISSALALGVSSEQLANVLNLSPAVIEKVKETPEYEEAVKREALLNRGWDAAEAIALKHVITQMQIDPDPEFALRVASLANKAKRRGPATTLASDGNITPQENNVVTINLTQNFVDKLSKNPTIEGIVRREPEAKKIEDTLDVETAEEILSQGKQDLEIDI